MAQMPDGTVYILFPEDDPSYRFVQQMLAEYTRSRKIWPAFVNYPHGLGVMVEEVLELVKDLNEGVPNLDNTRKECLQACAMIMAIWLELL